MKFIDEVELTDKFVFLRADLNAPVDGDKISDDTRLTATLKTLKYALDNGAKVILASHFGRPKGKEEKYSLKIVANRLSQLLKKDVPLLEDCIGEKVETRIKELNKGEVVLLENLRFHPEEEINDPAFARSLAKLAEIYVNDAFATAHRAHASTSGMVKHFKTYCGGFTIKDEVLFFEKAMQKPERPLSVIFGGSKVSTKLNAITNVAEKADYILIGGAMAGTFLKALNRPIGKSLFESEMVEIATSILNGPNGKKIILPVDFVCAKDIKDGANSKIFNIEDGISDEFSQFDIGPKSIENFKKIIDTSKTVVWNGPVGAFEFEGFSQGTFSLIEILANSKALSIVGGGDTDAALHQTHSIEKMGYVSTAGGAFLELLEGKKLPGLEALEGRF